MSNRKLQIFLSSTYEDLISERFAAMQAILEAGHIPASMEQFTPGEATAWDTIKHWIDESDAFILILGGRYGSIEPQTGKSYVQLEYEYAIETQKPFCALVVSDTHHEEWVRKFGFTVDEREHRERYHEFKRLVRARLCSNWSDVKELHIAILRKLRDWEKNPKLVGWVRSTERADPETLNEFARLSRENEQLRSRLAALSDTYDGLTFDELVKTLRESPVDLSHDEAYLRAVLDRCDEGVQQLFSKVIGAKPTNAGELFDGLSEAFSGSGFTIPFSNPGGHPAVSLERVLRKLFACGLITTERIEPQLVGRNSWTSSVGMTDESLTYAGGSVTYKLSELGRRFRNRMLAAGDQEARRRSLWSAESGGQGLAAPA